MRRYLKRGLDFPGDRRDGAHALWSLFVAFALAIAFALEFGYSHSKPRSTAASYVGRFFWLFRYFCMNWALPISWKSILH
jgi:hypothetical protein